MSTSLNMHNPQRSSRGFDSFKCVQHIPLMIFRIPTTRKNTWLPTNREDMKLFFACIVICIGMIWLPHLNLYCSKSSLYHNQFISFFLPRERFLLILSFLHFNDNEGLLDIGDRLYRIRPILDRLNERLRTIMTPGGDGVIDEKIALY